MRTLLSFALPLSLALALASPPSIASAQTVAMDTVVLPNGGRLRGTVEAYEPGTRVVILLPDGTRRTLAPGEFERVQFADEAPPQGPDGPETQSPGDMLAQPVPPPPTEPDAMSATDLQRLEAVTGPEPEIRAPTTTTGYAQTYGDGRRHTAPWNGVDPATLRILEPRGLFHLYIQAQLTGSLLLVSRLTPTVGGDLSVGVDLRLGESPLRLRAGPVLGVQTHEADSYGPGLPLLYETGLAYIGARATLGVDVTSTAEIRVGGEVGGEIMAVTSQARGYGGPQLDVVWRLLDDRRLELSASLAVQDRSGGSSSWASTGWSPRLALGIAGVLL